MSLMSLTAVELGRKIKEKEVVIVQSGIGKVNMALCTQILADRFDVKAVINTGVAGGLYKDIEIGDIVISKDAVQHDVDATVFGYKVGEIPRMDTSYFEADKDLIELAKKTCDEVNPDIHSYVGRVVSGDQFISDNKKKHYLINEFDGYCAEMEGAAMAQAAHLNQIPFIILRAISDKADQEAAGSYEEFEKAAIKHIVGRFLLSFDRYPFIIISNIYMMKRSGIYGNVKGNFFYERIYNSNGDRSSY